MMLKAIISDYAQFGEMHRTTQYFALKGIKNHAKTDSTDAFSSTWHSNALRRIQVLQPFVKGFLQANGQIEGRIELK